MHVRKGSESFICHGSILFQSCAFFRMVQADFIVNEIILCNYTPIQTSCHGIVISITFGDGINSSIVSSIFNTILEII